MTRQFLERFRNREIVSEMNDLVFITLVVTGFTVAFLHAAIPTHWLPFVVAARAQHWKKPKTLAVTGVAGAGHVLFTIALGVLVVWGGMAINSRIGKVFPVIAGGALITLGLFYLVRQIRGGTSHSHLFASHSHHKHEHEHHSDDHHPHPHARAQEHEYVDQDDDIATIKQRWSQRRSDWVVIAGLFALLTFSPVRGISPGFPDRRKIWLDWVCPAQCDPRHRYRRRDGSLYVAYSRGSGETEVSHFRKIRIGNPERHSLPARRVDHPI